MRPAKTLLTIFALAGFISLCLRVDTSASDLDPARERLRFADGLFARSMFRMAADEYQRCLESYPEDSIRPEALFGLAGSYFHLQEYTRAIDCFSEYIREFPAGESLDAARLGLSQCFFYTGQAEKSKEHLQALLDHPAKREHTLGAHFYLGKYFYNTRDLDTALSHYRAAAADAGDNPYRLYALADMGALFLARQEYPEAMDYFTEVLRSKENTPLYHYTLLQKARAESLGGEGAKAVQTYRAVLETGAENTLRQTALSELIGLLFSAGRYKEVVDFFGKYGDLFAAGDVPPVLTSAESMYLSGEKDRAFSLLQKMPEQNLSGRPLCLVKMKTAELFFREGVYEKVLKLLENLDNSCSFLSEEILFYRAESYYQLANPEKAFALYQKLIDDFPESALASDSLYGSAHSQRKLGDNASARESFLEFARRFPDDPRQTESLMLATHLALDDNLPEKAEDIFRRIPDASGSNQDLAHLCRRLADYFMENAETQKARDYYLMLLENYASLIPEPEDIYFQLGYIFQKNEDYRNSVEYYKKIDLGNFENLLSRKTALNLALAYHRLGADEEAFQLYLKSLAADGKLDLQNEHLTWICQYGLKTKRYEELVDAIGRMDQKYSRISDPHTLAFYKAEALRHLEKHIAAIEEYSRITESENPYRGLAYYGRSLSHSALNDDLATRGDLEEALKSAGENIALSMKSRFELATLEDRLGNAEDAAKLYMMIAILYDNPDYCPRSLYRAGELFQGLGSLEDAEKAFSELLARYPNHPLSAKIADRKSRQ